MLTCIGYYSKHILSFHFTLRQGKGTPLYRLYRYVHPQRVGEIWSEIGYGHFGQYLGKGGRTASPILFTGVTPTSSPCALGFTC